MSFRRFIHENLESDAKMSKNFLEPENEFRHNKDL